MLLHYLIRWMFGDTDSVHTDSKPWPNWLVGLLLVLFIVGVIVLFRFIAHANSA